MGTGEGTPASAEGDVALAEAWGTRQCHPPLASPVSSVTCSRCSDPVAVPYDFDVDFSSAVNDADKRLEQELQMETEERRRMSQHASTTCAIDSLHDIPRTASVAALLYAGDVDSLTFVFGSFEKDAHCLRTEVQSSTLAVLAAVAATMAAALYFYFRGQRSAHGRA